MILAAVLYATGQTSDPIVAVFLQYGVVGALCLVLAWFAWSAVKRERAATDEARAALQVANNRLIEAAERTAETVVPVLTQTRDALTATNDYLRDLARRRS